MDCFFRIKRYVSEMGDQPIHPVWLELKDKELQREFDLEQSKLMTYRTKVCTLALWIAVLLSLIAYYKNFGSNVYELVVILPLNVIMTAICIIGTYHPKLVKYTTLCMFLTRGVTTYLMFKLIDTGNAMRSSDKKQLTEAFTGVFIPVFTFIRFYPRIDLLLAPLLIVANIMTIAAALDQENNSMDCFPEPVYYRNLKISKLNMSLVIVIFASFMNRKTELTLFFEQR